MSGKTICVIIPSRSTENESLTLKSLANQTFADFDIVVVKDVDQKGACWARNQGFNFCKSPFVLFSDNDICWEEDALETMYEKLNASDRSYCYGWYEIGGKIFCNVEFDENELCKKNYISTMSLIRSSDFIHFDESILRLQDWDLWLGMLKLGRKGIYCGKRIFTTPIRDGITIGGITWKDAFDIVKSKYKL